MKIGIDARLVSQTGVGVYTRNLLYHLQDYIPRDWEVNVYLRKDDYDSLGFGAKHFIRQTADIHWHTFSEQTAFYQLLQKDNLDLMHFTYFSYPVMYRRPFVSTIHDLTPLLYKTGKASTRNPVLYELKHAGLRVVLSEVMKRSRAILTPSNAVKNEIVQRYGIKYASKIVATHEGLDEGIKDVAENAALGAKFKNFYVYVGNFYPHKNVHKLIDAFSLVDTDSQLVLVGPDDFFANKIKAHIKERNMTRKIILYTKPSREDMVFFYKHAKALIHPSLAEGFGLTLLEAAYFGRPIIASAIPVVRELLGESYVAFDPLFTTDMTEKIQRFDDKNVKFNYRSILHKYSFELMAKETVEVYSNVLHNKS